MYDINRESEYYSSKYTLDKWSRRFNNSFKDNNKLGIFDTLAVNSNCENYYTLFYNRYSKIYYVYIREVPRIDRPFEIDYNEPEYCNDLMLSFTSIYEYIEGIYDTEKYNIKCGVYIFEQGSILEENYDYEDE